MRTAARPPLNLTSTTLGLSVGAAVTRVRKGATTVVYTAALILSVQLSLLILDALHVHQDSATGTTDRLPALAISSGYAGLMEEPIPLGLTLGLATRLQWRWYAVLPLMIAMRIAFHVYYGPGALFVDFWMGAAYVLYRGCPLLWPFIVGHGIFDVLQILSDGTGARAMTFTVIEVIVATAGVVLAATTLRTRLPIAASRRPRGRVALTVATARSNPLKRRPRAVRCARYGHPMREPGFWHRLHMRGPAAAGSRAVDPFTTWEHELTGARSPAVSARRELVGRLTIGALFGFLVTAVVTVAWATIVVHQVFGDAGSEQPTARWLRGHGTRGDLECARELRPAVGDEHADERSIHVGRRLGTHYKCGCTTAPLHPARAQRVTASAA